MNDIGKCCFCNDDCNPNSQSCGRCSRTLTGFSLGWNTLPDHLHHVYPQFYPQTNNLSQDKKEDASSKPNNTDNKQPKN